MKTITEKILDGIKQTLETGEKVTIDLREAASLGGSGDGQGGRTFFDNAFAALRFGNPIREGARVLPISGSSMQFVAKTGNAANQTNPWGYSFTPNTGTPGTNTTIWQIPTRVITAQLPIRSAAMSDINYLNETLVEDLALEFATIEGSSMIKNDDQAGSLTTTTGGVDGLRGLNSYVSATTSAYGSSGTAITNGLHSIATVTQTTAAIKYDDLVNMASALPAPYWSLPGNAWMMHPDTIHDLRNLGPVAAPNIKQFPEVGDDDGGALAYVFGFPVIPNANMDVIGAGKFSVYLANWPRFVTIADVEEMTIQAMEETTPGFVTLYAEKRLVSSVRDPFAGVRLLGI
jgi:HK97 family phage major capsid protein